MLRHNVGPDGDPDDVVLNLWTAVLDINDVTHVDFAECERYGRTADELVGEDYTATHALADAYRAAAATAMVVPSGGAAGHPQPDPVRRASAVSVSVGTADARRDPDGPYHRRGACGGRGRRHVRWFGTAHTAAEQ